MVDRVIGEIARAWLATEIAAGRLMPELGEGDLAVVAGILLRANGTPKERARLPVVGGRHAARP